MNTPQRNSKKRQAIYDAVCASREHPSAEMVYGWLKPDIPDLSLGTVYRNLNLLTRQGMLIRVGHVEGQERYDGCTQPHAHFVCTRCGAVLDVPDLPAPDLSRVEALLGGRVESHILRFTGVCRSCCEK